MAKKTAIRRVFKYLPVSIEDKASRQFQQAVSHQDSIEEGGPLKDIPDFDIEMPGAE